MVTTTRRDFSSAWPELEPLLEGGQRPARYVGGEGNAIVFDHADCASAWMLASPDASGLDQPHQDAPISHDVPNEQPETVAERGYAPGGDALKPAHGIPQAGPGFGWYTTRRRPKEVFPREHLDSGLQRQWLWQDWQDALVERELDDCRRSPGCGCGVCPGLDLDDQTGHLPIVRAS